MDSGLLPKEKGLLAVVGVINGVVDGAPNENVAFVGVLTGDSSFPDGTGREGLGVPSKENGAPNGVVLNGGSDPGVDDGNGNAGFCGDGVPTETVVGVEGVADGAFPKEKGAGVCLTGVVIAAAVVGGAPNEKMGGASFFGSVGAGVLAVVIAGGPPNENTGVASFFGAAAALSFAAGKPKSGLGASLLGCAGWPKSDGLLAPIVAVGGIAKNELMGLGGSVTMTVGGGGDFLSFAWPPKSDELPEVGAAVPKLKGAGVAAAGLGSGGAPKEKGNDAGAVDPPTFPRPDAAPKAGGATSALVGLLGSACGGAKGIDGKRILVS